MGVETLISTTKTAPEKMVAVKLPTDVVKKIQSIRKSTGRTNAEIYTALLSEGLNVYSAAVSKTTNGKRRGRPPKNGASKKVARKPGRKKKVKA